VLEAVEGEPPPKPVVSALIGRLVLGHAVSEAEIDALPDPDLLRDAMFLHDHPTWTQRDLDETDRDLLHMLKSLRTKKG
jgi:hypothetical protein